MVISCGIGNSHIYTLTAAQNGVDQDAHLKLSTWYGANDTIVFSVERGDIISFVFLCTFTNGTHWQTAYFNVGLLY